MFEPVPTKPDFPAMERETLDWWRRERMMEKYIHRNDASDRLYRFLDGPITANNPMGVHHAWGRAYKDLYQRFKTMQGFRQRYQNGFDCQGLWIEVEVEREKGFKSKRDIEAYGIDRFVEDCKQRVYKFAGIQTEQSIRLGYWMDWDDSYYTLSDENNYTIWLFLKRCFERGWIYKGSDVMPWCPRCATGLSEHEIVTEGYKELTHPSVYLKFPLNERPGESLLVWTTTPWTLSSNTAAAVHPDLTYVRARQGDDVLILGKAVAGRVLQGPFEVLEELKGESLLGLTYRGPFDELPPQQGVVHRVVCWEEVNEAEGTGIVHIAPGCGAEDFALARAEGLPVIAPTDEEGNYLPRFDWLSGRNVADVTTEIFDDLRRKGLLYRVEDYTHRYPVCWRCDTELIFRLVDEWFIAMDQLRHAIMRITEKIRWLPEFGLARELDWLRNMDDWMISKKRYYGLALPIYECKACGTFEVIGSEVELRERAVEGWEQFEGHSPHRPWVDAVKIACPKCGQPVPRIRDVGNPWLDAGIVSYSTLKYRHDRAYWQEWFPADFITESFPGQFRNWFYSLLAMSTVMEDREPFRTVLGFATVKGEQGEEMHKSKGNAIWFDDAAEKMGVDVMRWLFFRHPPASNLNFGWHSGDEVRREFLLTLWNTYAFFATYSRLDGWDPSSARPAERTELDRWVLSELNALVADVTAALEEYDAMAATRRIEGFLEDLSNWYVRRSRRRFWKSESDADKEAAYRTLHTCLVTLNRLLAPFLPFVAEEMHRNLERSWAARAAESVHLEDWPQPDASLVDSQLNEEMRLLMRLASLGRSARSKAGIRVRQPLAAVYVKVRTTSEAEAARRLAPQLLDELNVKQLAVIEDASTYFEYEIKPNLPVLGPKYGRDLGEIGRALAALDAAAAARSVEAGERVEAAGRTLEPGEVLVNVKPRPGFAVAEEGGYAAVVSTALTPELEDEGLARELVHRLQTMRKDAGFDIADRIRTWYAGDGRIGEVMARFGEYVRQETLSVDLSAGPPPEGAFAQQQQLDGREVTLAVSRVEPGMAG